MDLFEADRSKAVIRAVEEMSSAGSESRGAIYTRREVVDFILDLAGYEVSSDLAAFRLLEPSFGSGEFLVAAVIRLLESFERHHKRTPIAADIVDAIRAVELHRASFEATKRRVIELLQVNGLSVPEACHLASVWLIQDDFLLTDLSPVFTHVVGNPPYVRQEMIPDVLMREYRRRYPTIYDRADLYIPFIERGLRLLAPGGALAFICADRWMKNRYGGPLRSIVAAGYHLRYYVDMVDTPAFETEVSAYPAIFVISRTSADETVITKRPPVDAAGLQELARNMREAPAKHPEQIQVSRDIAKSSEPWLFDGGEAIDLLRRLEGSYKLIEEVGCSVGIGVATGADAIFIRPDEELPVEKSRKLPILTTRDVKGDTVSWSGKYVLNPFEASGQVVELERYPLFAAYVNEHAERIKKRHVAKQRAWYRTIDRIYEELTWQPKLLIPDIAGRAQIIFDEGRFYPHHNFYYVTSKEWDLRALQTVLRSAVAEFFVAMYCVKMRGGYLRFQAQYIRRIRLPEWNEVPTDLQKRLMTAADNSQSECDRLAFELYNITPQEARIVRATDIDAETSTNGR